MASIFEVLGGFWTMSNFNEFFGKAKSEPKIEKDRHLGGANTIYPATFGRPGGMSGAAGGTFGGSEELVKLVKLGIVQRVLGIWNWAFDKNYKTYPARTAPRRGRGRRIETRRAHSARPKRG